MKTKLILICSLALAVNLSAQPVVKRVLMEEFTTTLCGMCPPQTWNVNQWHDQHTANTVLLTIHEGFGTDAMSNTFTDAIEQEFANPSFGFAPAIMIDRVTYPWLASEPYMPVGGFDSVVTRLINTESPRVGVNIQGTYNPSTRQISATVTANFLLAVPNGDYRISLFLVEDSVIGSGTGYDQKCYDATFANTHYPGQYNSSTSYISGYPHRHVLRAALTPTWGASSVIPNSPALSTNYSTTVSYTVPANYDDSKISLVAFVAHYAANSTPSTTGNGNRWVLNANETALTTNFTTAVNDIPAEQFVTMQVYPNPSAGFSNVHYSIKNAGDASLYISDLGGKRVMTVFEDRAHAAGSFSANLDMNEIAAGIYFVTLVTGEGIITSKMIRQ